MSYRISFSSLSNIDLEKIISHYHELNVSTAQKYYSDIITLIKKLKDFPLLGRIVPECEEIFYDTYRELIYENYRIIYRLEADQVFIVRIPDARSDIDVTFLE